MRKDEDPEEIKHGTGALVYDSGDYENLMEMLETLQPTTNRFPKKW